MVKYAEPNQKLGFVSYNREFSITVIVLIEFDCIQKVYLKSLPCFQTNFLFQKSIEIVLKKAKKVCVTLGHVLFEWPLIQL
jgi:hypothetical protein